MRGRDNHLTAVNSRTLGTVILLMLLVFCLAGVAARADWLKMDPPPDVDKKTHGHTNKPTCWLATAANMLAGAGYGTGSTVQTRADAIYNQLITNYGTSTGGWADTAMNWWLGSTNNTWTNNPYLTVTVDGTKSPPAPWFHDPQGNLFNITDDGPEFIANELRRCQMLGISITFTPSGNGHVFTAWGDNNDDPNELTSNPTKVIITDSDGMEYGGKDTRTYQYNKGTNGWFISYSNNTYIKHIVTLCPIDDPNDTTSARTLKHASSFRVKNNLGGPAGAMHHMIASNVNILTYLTTNDWTTDEPFIHERIPRTNVCFAWDLTTNTIPANTWVTVTDTMVLGYSPTTTVKVTSTAPFLLAYQPPPDPDTTQHDFDLSLQTLELAGGSDLTEPNITGGYVVGAFDLYSDPGGTTVVSEHRFCAEYKYFQDPENHQLDLISNGLDEPTWVGNFRFGHSYGLLGESALWEFEEWDVLEGAIYGGFESAGNGVSVPFVLPGLLPYPTAENYIQPVPASCGDDGTEYLPADFNEDCYVNLEDIVYFAQLWLECTDPQNQDCIPYE
jgi:hypothetical protein